MESKMKNWLKITILILVLCSLQFAKPSMSVKGLVDRFSEVETALGDNDFKKATQLLKKLVKDYSKSEFVDELRFGLAECYFNIGEYDQARKEFLNILSRPKFRYIEPEAMYGLAISSIMLGDYRKADLALENLSKKEGYEKDERTNFARGVLNYFRHDYKQAALKLDGLSHLGAKFYLAKSLTKLGKIQEALLTFKEITSAAPNTPICKLSHFSAGQALFENNDFDGARAKFEFFLENFSFSELADFAHYFLGCALIAHKNYVSALEHLKPLTKHSNNILAAHANYFVGFCKVSLGEPQEAITYFQKVRANYPKTMIAQYANLQLPYAILTSGDTIQTLLATSQLSQMFSTGDLSGVGDYFSGVVSYQMQDFRRAAKHFENVISKFPESGLAEPACALLLLSLNSSGAYERAITLGAKYIKDYPDRTSVWRGEMLYFLAEGYYYYKKFNEAENQYLKSQETKSGIGLYAKLGRAYCLFHLNRLSEAEFEFRDILNNTVEIKDTVFRVNALLGYAYSFFNQKKHLEALDVFEALVKQYPLSTAAVIPGLYYSGLCYFRLEYYGQAVDAWVMLINQYPLDVKSAEAGFRAGDLYFKAREFDKAVSTFRYVVEKYPYSSFGPGAQALIAQCFYNQKKYLEAVREYQKFLDLYPQDFQVTGVRKSLEMSYYQAGLENPVIMQEFLTRFPESELAAEAQFDKAKRLFDEQAFDQAAVEFQKVVVNFLNSELAGDAQLLTAESYANIKRWDAATTSYQKFLDYFPKHNQRSGAYFNLATAYFNLSEYDKALEKFQVVVDSFPKSEFVRNCHKNIELCLKKAKLKTNEIKNNVTEKSNNRGGKK